MKPGRYFESSPCCITSALCRKVIVRSNFDGSEFNLKGEPDIEMNSGFTVEISSYLSGEGFSIGLVKSSSVI